MFMFMLMLNDAISELLAVLPTTLLIGIALFCVLAVIRRFRRKKKYSLILLFFTSLYIAFLLYGTCFSRMKSIMDFLDFGRWSDGLLVFNVLPTSDLIHGLFNLILFLPWGILGMLYLPNCKGIIVTAVSAMLLSTAIEAFQRSHGMGFVIADISCNAMGGLLGAVGTFIVLSIWPSRKSHRTA